MAKKKKVLPAGYDFTFDSAPIAITSEAYPQQPQISQENKYFQVANIFTSSPGGAIILQTFPGKIFYCKYIKFGKGHIGSYNQVVRFKDATTSDALIQWQGVALDADYETNLVNPLMFKENVGFYATDNPGVPYFILMTGELY